MKHGETMIGDARRYTALQRNRRQIKAMQSDAGDSKEKCNVIFFVYGFQNVDASLQTSPKKVRRRIRANNSTPHNCKMVKMFQISTTPELLS
jgi:hypothetical protein